MKDFKALATERYSVRKFDTKPVEQEKVNIILEAARLAPTAHNYQPQRLLVLNTADSLNKLKDCTNGHFNAPLAIIVCYDNQVSWKREYDDADLGTVDASIVGSHIMFKSQIWASVQHGLLILIPLKCVRLITCQILSYL